MKKIILLTAFVVSFLNSFAQSGAKPTTPAREIDHYTPAADKRFIIEFSASELDFFLACAQFGFQPYIKTTPTPINQVETLLQSYTQVLKEKVDQFRKQYVADSLQHAKHN